VKAIIIGAGRGRRLQHLTDHIPKTLVPILGRPMLASILEALAAGGLERADTVFIAGYRAELVRQAYPDLGYVMNEDWPNNNILMSLWCARAHLSDGFVSTYSDIVYEPEAIAGLMRSEHDITLLCDTDWRRRYAHRSQHPESDAEKLRAQGDRVLEISRLVPAEQAAGEFIGVMRLTPAGAARFMAAFETVRAAQGEDAPFHEGRSLRQAYVIDLLQHMVAAGEPVHCTFVHGGYMEIDTTEDVRLAESWWRTRPSCGRGGT